MNLENSNIISKYWAFGKYPKTCSVYIKKLEKEYGRKLNILIPDSLDGFTAIAFLRAGNTVDCYEPNLNLINGGIVDNYNVIGFKKRLIKENFVEKTKIYNENFYKKRIEKEYDFVYSYRSLHLEHNKDIPKQRKIRKLLSSVKTGGYVYIFYYMFEDKHITDDTKNKYFKPFEMKSYFDLNDWDILYSIEGHKRFHKAHPYNNKDHYHITGSIFARKKNKRRKIFYRYIYSIK